MTLEGSKATKIFFLDDLGFALIFQQMLKIKAFQGQEILGTQFQQLYVSLNIFTINYDENNVSITRSFCIYMESKFDNVRHQNSHYTC